MCIALSGGLVCSACSDELSRVVATFSERAPPRGPRVSRPIRVRPRAIVAGAAAQCDVNTVLPSEPFNPTAVFGFRLQVERTFSLPPFFF